MSLLSYNRLVQLVEDGVISNVKPEQINGSSIDITLGSKLLIEDVDLEHDTKIISLKKRNQLETHEYIITSENCFRLTPGQFILAHSEQTFNLPSHISAEYKLKSSMARIGLEHLNAGWCDPYWHGSVLTLELKNMTKDHIIELHAGVAIGQMVFFEHEPVPEDQGYAKRGRYNNDVSVKGIKK